MDSVREGGVGILNRVAREGLNKEEIIPHSGKAGKEVRE